jgi:uncharacterized protein YbcV (DUF1398 family)
LKRHHTFYIVGKKWFDHPLKDDVEFEVADTFNEDAVIAAIAAFDKCEITSSQFLKALAAAGVFYARSYSLGKCSFYIGQKGEVYLEKW